MINYLKYLIFSIYIDDFIILNSYSSSTNKILNDPISKQTINKSDLFFKNWKKSQYAPALYAAHVCHSCTHTILTQRNELISIAHTHTHAPVEHPYISYFALIIITIVKDDSCEKLVKIDYFRIGSIQKMRVARSSDDKIPSFFAAFFVCNTVWRKSAMSGCERLFGC